MPTAAAMVVSKPTPIKMANSTATAMPTTSSTFPHECGAFPVD